MTNHSLHPHPCPALYHRKPHQLRAASLACEREWYQFPPLGQEGVFQEWMKLVSHTELASFACAHRALSRSLGPANLMKIISIIDYMHIMQFTHLMCLMHIMQPGRLLAWHSSNTETYAQLRCLLPVSSLPVKTNDPEHRNMRCACSYLVSCSHPLQTLLQRQLDSGMQICKRIHKRFKTISRIRRPNLYEIGLSIHARLQFSGGPRTEPF